MSTVLRRNLANFCLLILGLGAALATCDPANAATTRPCDILASSTPCVAAYSTVRALFGNYTKSLYQVTRASDSMTFDVGLLADGYADVTAQDNNCAGAVCTITKLYDQTSNGNDLTIAPPGGAARGKGPKGYDLPAFANALPATAGGHKIYGIYIQNGMGYRNDTTKGIAVNGAPEGVYMVASASHINGKCCFDFGNAETDNLDNNYGHMDAMNIHCVNTPCSPIAGLDVENGIIGHFPVVGGIPFVTVMGANDGQTKYTIWQGNAQSGALTSTGPTILPAHYYKNVHQEGAIILGIGGDNSDGGIGSFFEGAMTTGTPSDASMNEVQNNIVGASYAGLLP